MGPPRIGHRQLQGSGGATSLTALKAAGVEPNEISCVVLSHLHGNHFGGLPFLVLDGQFRGRERPLTVAGPAGTRERVEAARDLLFPGSVTARRRFAVNFVELVDRHRTPVGPALVTAVPVEVPDTPACALRVEYGGRVIAYSGDTAWTDELVDLTSGADLFVAEAYFFERTGPSTSTTPGYWPTATGWTAGGSSSRTWAPTCWPISPRQRSNAPTTASW